MSRGTGTLTPLCQRTCPPDIVSPLTLCHQMAHLIMKSAGVRNVPLHFIQPLYAKSMLYYSPRYSSTFCWISLAVSSGDLLPEKYAAASPDTIFCTCISVLLQILMFSMKLLI